MIKVNDSLFLIKLILNEAYDILGSEWNQILPGYKTFKKDGKVFFCEVVEELEFVDIELAVEEDNNIVENPII